MGVIWPQTSPAWSFDSLPTWSPHHLWKSESEKGEIWLAGSLILFILTCHHTTTRSYFSPTFPTCRLLSLLAVLTPAPSPTLGTSIPRQILLFQILFVVFWSCYLFLDLPQQTLCTDPKILSFLNKTYNKCGKAQERAKVNDVLS